MDSASRRAAIVGAFVAALVTVPGLGAGTLWDNSETAYGEVAREILLSHSWIVMHENGVPWFVQPPLYFWIAALFAQVLGPTGLAFRLPSALATIAMAAAAGYVVARVATPRAGILAATVLSTALMQAVIGRLAIMDALLDLAVALAILAWFGAVRTGRRAYWYGGWVAIALGTLAKGPVAPVVALLVVVPWACWERAAVPGNARSPRLVDAILGCALFAAILAPWAIALDRAAGAGAFDQLVGHYTVGRYLGTIENQAGPVWYYVPVVVLGFFPWFAFLVPAAFGAWRDARGEGGALARLALVWAVVPFVFFSFAKTKLPNYIALELPALAILVGLWFDGVAARDDRRAALRWTAVVPVTIALCGVALVVFSRTNRLSGDLAQIDAPLYAFGGAVLAGSIACFALLRSRAHAWLAPFALAASNVVVMLGIALFGIPIVERFKPIPPLAAVIDREREPGDVVAIQSVSGENALVFYTAPGVAVLAGPDSPADGSSPNDPRRTICSAARAFVVTSRERPAIDPTYGRVRRTIAASNGDVLFLYAGPRCDARALSPRGRGAASR